MRSKADETSVIVETLICPLQISHLTHNWNLAGQNFMRALACASFALFVCVACESLRAFSRLRNAKAFYINYFTL